MKNKNIIIAGIIILVLILIGGGIFVLSSKKSAKPADTTSTQAEEEILEISADEIGLKLTMGSDGKRVILQITKTEGINSLDYQLSYNSKGDIPRGAIGQIDVKAKGK